ncbi:MAG: hypothetical protein KKF89_04545 [Nanoarchaeota archaeon]|nr:hypothetical protein [Nanoarchaeota archaeon]
MNKTTKLTIILLSTLIYVFSVLLVQTGAEPVGATVSNISTVSQVATAGDRDDNGGTITTINVNVSQQNYAWKAYVGNITGTLSLDDANGYTIYEWSLTQSNLSGEIYATRYSSLSWTDIACANSTIIAAEQTAVNMSVTDGDNINATFSKEKHPTFIVAGETLANSSCPVFYTYYNGTSQADAESSKFPEIIIQNSEERLVYVTKLEKDVAAYTVNSTGQNHTYDFQFLVADDDRAGQITTYYFYAELDS